MFFEFHGNLIGHVLCVAKLCCQSKDFNRGYLSNAMKRCPENASYMFNTSRQSFSPLGSWLIHLHWIMSSCLKSGRVRKLNATGVICKLTSVMVHVGELPLLSEAKSMLLLHHMRQTSMPENTIKKCGKATRAI